MNVEDLLKMVETRPPYGFPSWRCPASPGLYIVGEATTHNAASPGKTVKLFVEGVDRLPVDSISAHRGSHLHPTPTTIERVVLNKLSL